MTRSKRFAAICDVFADRERDAVLRLADAERALTDAQSKLDELTGFRDEYSKRMSGGRSADPRALADLAVFVARLDLVIDGQSQQVEQAILRRDRSRQLWMQSRQRQQALGTVRDKLAAGERQDADRREQTESDALSGRMYRAPRL